ncbi:MAG: hypothetical protein ONB49_08295, partial [candidate division KSB1 bacterium]|nr:hypothetical protein [candidate division KSB1 bacterium]
RRVPAAVAAFLEIPLAAVTRDGRRVVEIRDLQFMIDRGVLRAIGFAERSLPFILRYTFSARGDLSEMKFNEEPVPRPVLSK